MTELTMSAEWALAGQFATGAHSPDYKANPVPPGSEQPGQANLFAESPGFEMTTAAEAAQGGLIGGARYPDQGPDEAVNSPHTSPVKRKRARR
jgi:hypothetical protein